VLFYPETRNRRTIRISSHEDAPDSNVIHMDRLRQLRHRDVERGLDERDQRRRFVPVFTLTTVGGRATVTRQFGRAAIAPIRGALATTSASFTYANEWEEYSISDEALADLTFRDRLIAMGLDPRFGTGRGQRSAISLDLGANWNPTADDGREPAYDRGRTAS
jgi:hypothetical protein